MVMMVMIMLLLLTDVVDSFMLSLVHKQCAQFVDEVMAWDADRLTLQDKVGIITTRIDEMTQNQFVKIGQRTRAPASIRAKRRTVRLSGVFKEASKILHTRYDSAPVRPRMHAERKEEDESSSTVETSGWESEEVVRRFSKTEAKVRRLEKTCLRDGVTEEEALAAFYDEGSGCKFNMFDLLAVQDVLLHQEYLMEEEKEQEKEKAKC